VDSFEDFELDVGLLEEDPDAVDGFEDFDEP
jgi:hypothetical protein